MKTKEDLRNNKIGHHIKAIFAGEAGDGKTYLAGTFPKVCFATTLPGELDTVFTQPNLMANLVGWEEFIPSPRETSFETINRFNRFVDEEVYPKIVSGEIETFVLDTLTSFAQYGWFALNEEPSLRQSYMSKANNFDSIKAYGGLRDMMYKQMLNRVLALPCNVIINCHLMVEDEKTLEKKRDGTSPYNLAVLGSIRDVLPSMVSFCFYLSKEYDEAKKDYTYFIRTNKGAGKRAKSRLALPPVIKGASYTAIRKAIDDAMTAADQYEKEKLKEK